MPHYDELFPGRFLKSKALEHPITIRIIAIGGEELEGDDGVKHKAVVKYKTRGADGAVVDGEMVWAKTNAMLAEAMFGTGDYLQWVGHLVTIGYDPTVSLGAERVGGLRIVGSPELQKEITATVKLPRRKARKYSLVPTDAQGRKRETRAQAPAAPPPPDDEAPPPDDGYTPDPDGATP